MQTPLLTFLRRLEAQNIWRVTYNALPQQQQQYSTSHSGQDNQQQDGAYGWNWSGPELAAPAASARLGFVSPGLGPLPVQFVSPGPGAQRAPLLTPAAPGTTRRYSGVPATPGGAAAASAAGSSRGVSTSAAAAVAAAAAAPAASTTPSAEWYHDESVSAQDALRLLVARIQTQGPVKQHHLQALYARCRTGDELDRALRLTRLNHLARGALEQHAPFSHATSRALVSRAMTLGVPELAARALENSAEFGLPRDTLKEATPLLIYHSKRGDLTAMLRVYEGLKKRGRHPGPDVCYVLVKGCVDWGRADLAHLVIAEFEQAGVRIREGTRAYLGRKPLGVAAVDAGTQPEDGLPTADEIAGAMIDHQGALAHKTAGLQR